MNTNWAFQEPIDFEHKQYVLLDYLQKIDKNLERLKLYPNFQSLSLHLANINLLIEKGQFLTMTRELSDPDDEILISDLVANSIPTFESEDIIEIYNVCRYANEQIQDFFNQAKAIWEVANDSISVTPILNKKQIEPKQGLFFINFKGIDYLYEFIVKNIKKDSNDTKCLIKRICSCKTEEYQEKLKTVKNPLIKNLNKEGVYQKLILFRVNHNDDLPLKETLLPIAKRKIMNYVIQSKLINKIDKNN